MVSWAVNTMASLLGKICEVLIKDIYPIIPKLYRLFEYISTFKLLDSSFLNKVWNNIYIFVAVIALFAIAIKLIGTIVNPDTLSDNKKGVKAYYFRAVTAVVLIFIIPMLFDYSFELQQDLVSKNFLNSRIFGFKINDKADVGQVLAWQTFSAFCAPVAENELSENAANAYMFVEESTDAWSIIYLFEQVEITDKPVSQLKESELKTAFRLHPILCFVAGVLIAYELLLLCMDTLFRSAKLAFLEMMVPVILGAYVFNPEILKKWAKEFFSTYISLFFKILALGFMILSFSQIKGVVSTEAAFKDDSLLSGLFQAILVIGMLQLVKKIPDLINSIFGTNIKSAGGIKGRLGEMAGIGGLAQKAWSSLGNKAANLAKVAAVAPAGLAGMGINALYKKKFGKNIGDTKLGRWGRALGSGISTAASTGNAAKSFEAGTTAYNKLSADPLDKVRRTERVNKDLDKILTNPDTKNSYVNEKNVTAKYAAKSQIEEGVSKYGGKKVADANKNYQTRLEGANIAQAMAKNFSTVLEENEKAAQHWEQAGRADLAKKIRDANDTFKNGGLNVKKDLSGNVVQYEGLDAMKQFIMQNQDLYGGDKKNGSQVVNTLIGTNGKLTSMERQYKFLTQKDGEGKNMFKLSDDDIVNLEHGEAGLSFLANTTLKGKADSAKSDLDIAIAGAKLSDIDKMSVEKYISAESDLNSSMGFAVGRKESENGLDIGVKGYGTDDLIKAYTMDNDTERTLYQQTETGSSEPTEGTTASEPEYNLSDEESEVFDEIMSNGLTPSDPEFAQMAGSNADRIKEYYSSQLYDKLTDEEKEFLSDAKAEGFNVGDPEFEQMRKDRSINGKNILDYLKWKK